MKQYPTNPAYGMSRQWKAWCSLILAAVLFLSCLPMAAAEQKAEYRDDVFSFQYPAAWKRRSAKDGSLILEIPGQNSGVQAFSMATNLIELTGDQQKDDSTIQMFITQQKNSNSKMKFNGKYDMLQYGDLHGFRAFGTINGSIQAQQCYLSNGSQMLVFRFIGQSALAAQEDVLASIVMFKAEEPLSQDGAPEGYIPFSQDNYAFVYPEGYKNMEMNDGFLFLDASKKNTFAVRKRTLDTDYTEAQAPSLASTYLPKSTKLKADPEMVTVGPWNAARITGDTASGPLAFYALGKGRTALFLLFLGQEALTQAEAVLKSITIE
jgi:hypothetical protein